MIYRADLINIHRGIEQISNGAIGIAIGYLLQSKIRDFYKEYGIRIRGIIEYSEKLREEYFELDENKQFKMRVVKIPQPQPTQPEMTLSQKVGLRKYTFIPPVPDKEERKPIMKEGKTEEEFYKLMNEYLEQPISVIVQHDFAQNHK